MIDYILYQGNLRYGVKDVRVIRGAELGTDHRLLVADTGFEEGKMERQRAYTRINHEELRCIDSRERYRIELSARIENMQNSDNDVDDFWNGLKDAIIGAAKEVYGERRLGRFKKRTRWWTEEVKMKVREEKKAFRKYMETKRQHEYRIYVEKINDAKRIVKLAKMKSWQDFGQDLQDKHGQNNGRAFWKVVRCLRGKYGKQVRTIVDEEGRSLSQKEEVLDRWRSYYENEFQMDNAQDEDNRHEFEQIGNEIDGITSAISREEVVESIKGLKVEKAAREDEELKLRQMMLNVKKSKVMVVSKGMRENVQVMVDGEEMDQVAKYDSVFSGWENR
ncbi:uncharacterized protein LOC120351601 [Nilaparvata lugens]|uniref:uncharacterized protein LOC120351601 n=1 Tax=Nilaparvata lugens TaxID=108931 RepID=UPI00193E8F4C|nr:uncharacterized protein LOC120351601 [Nilaparvata lugens]